MKRPPLLPTMIFALLGLNVCIVAITVYLATSDESFAVEPAYYQRAVAWDEAAAQARINAQLGWTIEALVESPLSPAGPSLLRLQVRDAAGKPVTGASVNVVGFASIAAARRYSWALTEEAPGVYVAPCSIDRAGIWEIRVAVVAGRAKFTADRSIEVLPAHAPGEER